ncbi:reverse transcriptase, RNA-dependent DNA polymerase, LTR copia-type gag-polypeptide [Tanacetum coccineum]|uniref:Reverse transcriptase, RNA-dependent DNA polymerase, LTR copia-type gag-polypeptide n=1 Tax=Tanacetum coccineum TaxID=301880 RepID=A0ABQ5HP52_9ASTR
MLKQLWIMEKIYDGFPECQEQDEDCYRCGERDQRRRLIQLLMGLDECYANIRVQNLLMNQMSSVAKAYNIIRQEEKQKEGFASRIPMATAHSNNYRNSYNNNGRNGKNYSQCETSNRNLSDNDNIVRRSVFRKGVICGNCSKEGHTREECYKLLGYHVGHHLHGKYKPPHTPQRFNAQNSSAHWTVNVTMGKNLNA